MEPKRLDRKLSGILYADVAGYSRLTGEDEDGTHRALRAYLDVITSHIQAHKGRVVHYAGDAVLAEFGTVSDALRCAVDVQRDLMARNQALPDERKVQFRIGVNLGEVIVDQDEIYGDGVNVAARLESLAEPGGICISDAVRSAVGGGIAGVSEDRKSTSQCPLLGRLLPDRGLHLVRQLPTQSRHSVRRLKRVISASCGQRLLQGVAFADSLVATRRQKGGRTNAVPAVSG